MKTVLVALGLAAQAFAQANIQDALQKHWKAAGEFTLAVAKAMPADGYSFRPVPEEMSFGQVMIHISGPDLNACALASGMDKPAIPAKISQAARDEKGEIDKDTAVQFVTDTFDFCNRAVASMTPDKLNAVVGTSRKMTGFEWLWAYFTHTAHHRGQAEVYLRLKGIKPPPYVF